MVEIYKLTLYFPTHTHNKIISDIKYDKITAILIGDIIRWEIYQSCRYIQSLIYQYQCECRFGYQWIESK